MSCKFQSIEYLYRESNPALADKLTQDTLDVWHRLRDSNLFAKRDNKYFLSTEGTKKRLRQVEFISSLNAQLGKEGVKIVDNHISVNIIPSPELVGLENIAKSLPDHVEVAFRDAIVLKSTQNIQVRDNDITITWGGANIKFQSQAIEVAKDKVNYLNSVGNALFPDKKREYAKLDSINPNFIRILYGIPSELIKLESVKKGESTIDQYAFSEFDNTFYNKDGLREVEDNYESDFYPSTLELDQDDKDVFELYKILGKEFTGIDGEQISKEDIEQVLFKYNEDKNLDRRKLPDLKDPKVLIDLKLIRREFITASQEAHSLDYIKRSTARYKEVVKSVREILKDYKGTFKPLLNMLADLLKADIDQLSKAKINLAEAKKEKNESRIRELTRNINILENKIAKEKEGFNNLAKYRDLTPIVSVIKGSVSELSNTLFGSFTTTEDYTDKLFTAWKQLDYFDSVVRMENNHYVNDADMVILNELAEKRVFNQTAFGFDLLTQEVEGALSLRSAIQVLKIRRDALVREFLDKLANEMVGSNIHSTIQNATLKIEEPEFRRTVLDASNRIIKDRHLHNNTVTDDVRRDTNHLIVSIKDKAGLDKDLKDSLVDFLKNLMNKDIDYVNIYEQVKEINLLKYATQDISNSSRLIDQVLAMYIQGMDVEKTNEFNRLTGEVNDHISSLEKRGYNSEKINAALYRKSKSGLRSQALKRKYSQQYDDELRIQTDLLKSIKDIEKDPSMSTHEKIDRIKTIRDNWKKWLNDNKTHINIEIVFGHKFQDTEYLKVRKYSQAEIDSHIANVKAEIGEDEYNELYKKQEELIDQYLFLRKSNLDDLEKFITFTDNIRDRSWIELKYTNLREDGGKLYGIKKEDYNDFLIDDIRENPMVYSNFISHGETVDYNGNNLYSSYRYVETVPKKFKNGKETTHYDKDFEKIQEDKGLKGLYDIAIGAIKTLKYQSSDYELESNVVTLAEKSAVESIIQNKINGKTVFDVKNALKRVLSVRDRAQDSVTRVARVYGVKDGIKEASDIRTLNHNYDIANKEQIDRVFSIEKQQIEIELKSEGYTGRDLEKELDNRTKDLREHIVDKLVQEATQDPAVTINSMIQHALDLKYMNEYLPTLRLYEKGLDSFTLGKNPNTTVLNNHLQSAVDEHGKSQTKISTRRAAIYKDFLSKITGHSIHTSMGEPVGITPSIGEDGNLTTNTLVNNLIRTKEEEEEIDKLYNLYKQYKKLHTDGKISSEELDLERAKINAQLIKYTIYRSSAVDILANVASMGTIGVGLYFSNLGSIINRIGGIMWNMINTGRYYSYDSWKKSAKLLTTSSESLSLFAGAGAVTATIAFAGPLLASMGMVSGLWLIPASAIALERGYALGKKVGDLFTSKNPSREKFVNIMKSLGVFKMGDIISHPDSTKSKIDKRLEAFNPMIFIKHAEFINAAEQAGGFLNEMKVEVQDGKTRKSVGWEDLFDQHGTLNTFDKYYVPGRAEGLTKRQMFTWLGGIQFMIASSTGQYDTKFPSQAEKSSLGRLFTMFAKWRINSLYNFFDEEVYKNYTIPNLMGNTSTTYKKGVLSTLRDSFGNVKGLSIASLLFGGAAYVGVGAAGVATAASLAIPLTIAASTAAISGANILRGKKKGAPSSPSFINDAKKLEQIAQIMTFNHYFKKSKDPDAKSYSSLSNVDVANLKFVRNLSVTLLTMFLVTEVLRYLIHSRPSGGDDKDDELAKLLKLVEYTARQSSQNASGIVNSDNIMRDMKGGIGLNSVSNTISAYAGTIVVGFEELLYELVKGTTGIELESLEKDTKYQKDGREYKEGDSKFMHRLEKLPIINKIRNIQNIVNKPEKK